MSDALSLILRFAATLGCGLMGGLFFAFSVSVMGALARIKPHEGIAAMQAINRVILNPIFLCAFLGTAILCIAIALISIWQWREAGAAFFIAGAALYVIGTFLVTMVFNVPLNDALAGAQPESVEGGRLWTDYLKTWTTWNHVRTVTSFAATAFLTIGLYLNGLGARD
jgi:uncharacterized membrane protein